MPHRASYGSGNAPVKKLSALLFCAFVALLAVLGFNNWRAAAPLSEVAPATPLALDTDAAAQRLSDAVRIATVSSATDPQANAAALTIKGAWLDIISKPTGLGKNIRARHL